MLFLTYGLPLRTTSHKPLFFRFYHVRRLVGEDDVTWDGMSRFLDVAHESAVDFDFRAFPGLAVVGGQLGSPFDLGIRRRHVMAGQDDGGNRGWFLTWNQRS